jgi:hypothetical protein
MCFAPFFSLVKATFKGAQVAVKKMRSLLMQLTDQDIEEFRKEAYMMSRCCESYHFFNNDH